MNKDLKQWAWDMQRTIDSALERINNNTLSDKDAVETATMLLQLDHEVRNDPEYHTDTVIPAISVALNELYDALNNRDTRMLRLDNDVFRQLLSFGEILITKEDRAAQEASETSEREDGRTYIDFLPRMPHEQYLQLVENLKEIGAKYDPELKQWYVDKDWEPKKEQEKILQGNEISEKTESSNIGKDRRFKAVYYDNSVRKEIFSSSKADAIDAVRRQMAPAPVSRFLEEKVLTGKERCYIQELGANSQYQQEGIYLVASGRDVTPIEIHLPYMRAETFKEVREEIKKMGVKFDNNKKVWYLERGDAESKMDMLQNYLDNHDEAIYLKLPRQITSEQFKEVIGQLKLDGARYNPDKKAWYITDRNDISKFSEYLPPSSIHEKLENNKRTAYNAENISGRGRFIEPRKQEERLV